MYCTAFLCRIDPLAASTRELWVMFAPSLRNAQQEQARVSSRPVRPTQHGTSGLLHTTASLAKASFSIDLCAGMLLARSPSRNECGADTPSAVSFLAAAVSWPYIGDRPAWFLLDLRECTPSFKLDDARAVAVCRRLNVVEIHLKGRDTVRVKLFTHSIYSFGGHSA